MASLEVLPVSRAPVNVSVIGTGAFGRNHVRIYADLAKEGLARLTAIVDLPGNDAARALAAAHGAEFYSNVEELLIAVSAGKISLDAASVCVPTSLHAGLATALLDGGIHVLVEKPIASSLEDADVLLQRAAANRKVLQIGHLERFNPAVVAVLPHLTRPMFFECHRLSVFTPRSLDIDVVLDLMIHDLDIVLRMAGSQVCEIRAVGLPVLSNHADIANVRLEFGSGCVANLTASRVSTEKVRKLRLFQPHQYISIDYARQDAFRIEVSANADPAPASSTGGQFNMDGLQFHKLPVQPGEPLRLEIEAFLQAVRSGQPSPVPAQESRDALALALAVNGEMARHAAKTSLH
jgi:predicted dehydrogenase